MCICLSAPSLTPWPPVEWRLRWRLGPEAAGWAESARRETVRGKPLKWPVSAVSRGRLCELQTHGFPLSSGLTSAHLPGSWAGGGSLWGQSCVNHTHLPSAPRVWEEAHAAQDAAMALDVQGRGATGRVSPRPVSSDARPSGASSGVRTSSSKDSSQNGLKTTLTDSLNLNS